jgi:hypothetical protein
MRISAITALACLLLASACSGPPQRDANAAAVAEPVEAAKSPIATGARSSNSSVEVAVPEGGGKAYPPVEPPAPGTPGGLPDDRNPISEAPFTPTSAQGAANVVQTYYALLEAGKYGEAWKLWSDGGKASGMTREAFAASFAKYAEYHAQVGAPGRIEGAAGSSYVDVPVVVYGRLKSGGEVHMNGPVTLRRVNDVPGSSAEQRLWHISASGVRPRLR